MVTLPNRSKDNPWKLQTPPGTSEFTMHLKLPRDKVNVNGGACALGHPIGATGSRILVTLLYALKARGLKRGIAGHCAGGGEATAIALEII